MMMVRTSDMCHEYARHVKKSTLEYCGVYNIAANISDIKTANVKLIQIFIQFIIGIGKQQALTIRS